MIKMQKTQEGKPYEIIGDETDEPTDEQMESYLERVHEARDVKEEQEREEKEAEEKAEQEEEDKFTLDRHSLSRN